MSWILISSSAVNNYAAFAVCSKCSSAVRSHCAFFLFVFFCSIVRYATVFPRTFKNHSNSCCWWHTLQHSPAAMKSFHLMDAPSVALVSLVLLEIIHSINGRVSSLLRVNERGGRVERTIAINGQARVAVNAMKGERWGEVLSAKWIQLFYEQQTGVFVGTSTGACNEIKKWGFSHL